MLDTFAELAGGIVAVPLAALILGPPCWVIGWLMRQHENRKARIVWRQIEAEMRANPANARYFPPVARR